ncbi:MAG: hypothetical protein GWP06_11670, partial [Actinobacteria bacterium]|nr:hypothetical protein [Actinomycetota bacterium]
EGFVFISGYVAGIVYSRIFFKTDLHVLTKRTQKRAWVIYFYHLILFLGILLLCVLVPSLRSTAFKSLSPLFFDKPVQSVVLGSVLLYQPVYLNILPMYVIFILLLPVFFHMFYNQKEKTVFVISIAFWFLAQAHLLYRLSLAIHDIVPVNLGNFDIMGWQFIFMIGSYLGFRKFKSEQINQHPIEKATLNKKNTVLIFIAVYVFFLMLRYGIISSHIPPKLFRHLFDVHSLGLLRLANFFTLAYLISFTASFFEKKKITKFFAFLGQHSLQVYSFHIIILYAIILFCENWQIFLIYIQLLLYFLGIALLFFSAWLHRCYQLKTITFRNLVIV